MPTLSPHESFSCYVRKLAVLHRQGVLRAPILYPVGGVDYFPATYGHTIYLDHDPVVLPSAYLPCLRKKFPESPPFHLPDNTHLMTHVCEDVLSPPHWLSKVGSAGSLLLKGAFDLLASPPNPFSESAQSAVRSLAERVVAGGTCLLFDGDIALTDLLLDTGWHRVSFADDVEAVLSSPSGGVIEMVGPDFDYAVGVKSGGVVHVLKKDGAQHPTR